MTERVQKVHNNHLSIGVHPHRKLEQDPDAGNCVTWCFVVIESPTRRSEDVRLERQIGGASCCASQVRVLLWADDRSCDVYLAKTSRFLQVGNGRNFVDHCIASLTLNSASPAAIHTLALSVGESALRLFTSPSALWSTHPDAAVTFAELPTRRGAESPSHHRSAAAAALGRAAIARILLRQCASEKEFDADMDAKPQRPRLRVHDENMPPPALPGVSLPGKTLHQRTKSTPALSSLVQAAAIKATQKKILGEANANTRLQQAAKDDSEVGKASPGKLGSQEVIKPTATSTVARPAARPLAVKPSVANGLSSNTTAVSRSLTTLQRTEQELEPVRKVVAKKSVKVLKEAQPTQLPVESEVKIKAAVAPANQSLAAPAKQVLLPLITAQPSVDLSMPSIIPIQRHEVRKTESVPLKDDSAARPLVKPTPVPVSIIPPGFTSEQEYLSYLDYHNAQYQLQQQTVGAVTAVNGQLPYLSGFQPLQEQYYEIEEEDYGYEEGYTTARSFGLQGESTGGITTILAPKITANVEDELRIAKEYVDATRPAEDVEDELWDTSMVAEYGEEIFKYYHELEDRMAPNPRYMEQQTEIQWSMRAVLMDWVIQVHQRFNLLPETLFLTVNYIDRFLSCKVVSLGKLQLVGATAIFVAAKYEEVQCPTIAEIIYMVDGGYTADELLKAERFMLSMLKFELGWPGPMSFLRRISKADDYDLETRTLAKYFLEVTVMDERFVGCTPSFLAAGAHCMARLFIYNDEWSKAHVHYSGYTWTQLRELLVAILECCEDPHKHHSAVYDKYTDKRYKKSSTYVADKLAKGFRLSLENPSPRPLTPHSGMSAMSMY